VNGAALALEVVARRQLEPSMAIFKVNEAKLVLVSARKSRGAVHWDNDNCDVRFGDANGAVIGRIMRHPQAPEAQPWYWTITARKPNRPRSIIAATQRAANRRCDILRRGT
jgi:hypothetical protein